jgi:hypothetical protein
MDQAQALMSGESVVKAAERAINRTTAFRWRHRFLSALNLGKPTSLSGIVEADETFVLESFKGKRKDLPRPLHRRGGKASKRGLSAEQIPIIVSRDRTGATLDAVLPRLDAVSIMAALGGVIAPSTDFCCDGGAAISAFARRARLELHALPAPGNPKPEAPEHHINKVNAYHGRLRELGPASRWNGTYNIVLDYRKLKVSGLRRPRLFRLAAAKRPTSIRWVLSGYNDDARSNA